MALPAIRCLGSTSLRQSRDQVTVMEAAVEFFTVSDERCQGAGTFWSLRDSGMACGVVA